MSVLSFGPNGASRTNRAFTLLELVLVFGILAILLALLLPAVVRVRDASSRAACSNNLRQIGIALHEYHNAMQTLPSGIGINTNFYQSWHADLLPYLEQDSVAELNRQILLVPSFGVNAPYYSSIPPSSPLWQVLGTNLPVFVCPADGQALFPQPALYGTIGQAGLTSYLGVDGTNRFRQDGVLYRGSRVRFSEITDGTSCTLAVGERPAYSEIAWGLWYTGIWGLDGTGAGASVLGARETPQIRSPYQLSVGRMFLASGLARSPTLVIRCTSGACTRVTVANSYSSMALFVF